MTDEPKPQAPSPDTTQPEIQPPHVPTETETPKAK